MAEEAIDPIEELSTGEEANREETLTSAKIAFMLVVLSFCILLVHYLIAKAQGFSDSRVYI